MHVLNSRTMHSWRIESYLKSEVINMTIILGKFILKLRVVILFHYISDQWLEFF